MGDLFLAAVFSLGVITTACAFGVGVLAGAAMRQQKPDEHTPQ